MSLSTVVLLLAAPGAASAQLVEPGTVSGNAHVTISRQPETMRVQIALQGKGATLKDALTAVKSRGDAARKQLTTLGAAKDSIKVESPKVAEKNDQQNQRQMRMQMMMMQRMRQGGKAAAPKKAKTAEPILVSAMLTAEWKLDAKSPDELLLSVHSLQEKIKAADLAGTKDAEKLSAEQEEMLEEMEDQMQFGSDNEPKPGEPVFMFISRISDADREKALAEAFQKAKTQATRVAKAAGAELGSLKSLTASSSSAGGYNQYGNYNQHAYRAIQLARQAQGIDEDGSDDETEAMGVEPGPVKITVTVMASFDLKHGK
jgi:uncharacterized protein YggE